MKSLFTDAVSCPDLSALQGAGITFLKQIKLLTSTDTPARDLAWFPPISAPLECQCRVLAVPAGVKR